MIDGLKPYPKYKDSGVPWLGEVPEHWEVRSLGSITSRRSIRGRPDLPLLSVVREKGVILRATMSDDENHNFIPDDLTNYKVVRKGDLVINKMKAWQGSLGIAPVDGIVSPAYFVLSIGIADREFAHALLRSRTYVDFFARASDGVRVGQWDLAPEQMKRIPVALPPGDEQRAIAYFVQCLNYRVARYIRAKKKLIALLNEQKQAIIHCAVTRGLDATVQLKDSGVEWLGRVPAHWSTLPLKRLFTSMDYGISEATRDEGAIRVLTMSHIRDGKVTVPAFGGVPVVDQRLLLEAGDLVFNRTNSAELVGKVGLFNGSEVATTFASYLVRMRPLPGHDPRYLNYVLNDRMFLAVVRREAIPSLHQSNLNPSRYGRLVLAVPDVEEQRRIVRHIERATQSIETAATRGEEQLRVVHELRVRLTSDVITGRVDVREAAAHLPLENTADEFVEIGDTDEALADDAEVEMEAVEVED